MLHFVWKYRKLPENGLKTSDSEALKILKVGTHNVHSGPDFFNAKLEIGGQLWAGNVEIHVKASDWYLHSHEQDEQYSNVILHVVWEDDMPVFRHDHSRIPSLELKHCIPEGLLRNYRRLFHKKQLHFVNCERELGEVDPFLIRHWLERLYFERLEQKAEEMEAVLSGSRHNWEQVLFICLLKNFGLNVNGASFYSLGRALDFSVIRKTGNNILQLESLFFGLTGLLDDGQLEDSYYLSLKEEYRFLQRRFSLGTKVVLKPEFARLRPANFPTLRLSQFATLYGSREGIFSKVIEASCLDEVYALFRVSASSYWNSHYTFGKPSGTGRKFLSTGFINLLLINTLLPLKFCYARYQGRSASGEVLNLIAGLMPEKNRVTARFEALGLLCENGKDSQGLLQLYREYCSRNRCLHCAIGSRLLNGK